MPNTTSIAERPVVGGFFDLLDSAHGVVCIVVLLIAAALVALGKLPGEKWLAFAQAIVLALVTSKTVTGTVETIKRNNNDQQSQG